MTNSQPRRTDGLGLVVALVQTLGTAYANSSHPGSPGVLGYALLAISGLAVGDRRRRPSGTVVFTAALTVGYVLAGYPSGPVFLAVGIATVSALVAGRHGPVWMTGIIAFVVWAVVAGPTFGRALTVVTWMVGLGLATEAVLGVWRLASRMMREEQRLSEERRRRKASDERLRIAAELHDVLGHHLSLINVRASVGRHLLDREPEQARAALDTIKEASAEALREVRSVLETLYPTGEAEAPRAPVPRLERLDELTADAGLAIGTTVVGEPRPLPPEVDRAAYRIVQEALTNVRRHAGFGAAAQVVIEYGAEDVITVQVEDDGGAGRSLVGPVAEGNGISGMRERAAALGGTLVAGPRPDGGWQVRALLPAPRPTVPEPDQEPAREPEPERSDLS